MKRLFFLLICMFAVPLVVFAAEVGEERASQEQIEKTEQNAKTEQANLKKEQEILQKSMAEQKEKVDRAPQDEKEKANLDKMQAMDKGLQSRVDSLSEYLNKVTAKQEITPDDIRETNVDITDAQKIIDKSRQLRVEFVMAETSESQAGQEAQTQVEKLGLWDTFKLNVQSVIAQTKATLASFFDNKEAAVAAHKDLIDIYNQLKDYGGKAQSAGQLASLYKELGDFGNAIAAQVTQLDALNNTDLSLNKKLSLVNVTMSDLLSLKDSLNKGSVSMTDADLQTMANIETRINNFLGDLGYKIDKVSAYEALGLNRNATVAQIRKAFFDLSKKYHPDKNPGNLWAENKFKEISNAVEALLGPSKNDETVRNAYDKLPIVKQGFIIRPMTGEELNAFQQQKAGNATQQQTDIVGGIK